MVLYLFRNGDLSSIFFNVHILIGLGLNLLLPVAGGILYKNYRRGMTLQITSDNYNPEGSYINRN
ncbi:MAG: hypothetical protein B6229_01605 [Spirochaetaceae bacterium 4572_7]|nr:MAG: hypothetical protein B6229_01605 [Spirochaetaceae bacterium 4572_7]